MSQHSSVSDREPKFMIVSLPRCGSTSLARILNAHHGIRCLMEPFHPQRYGGVLHRAALAVGAAATLTEIARRWNGIKHVFEAGGWPFVDRPEVGDDIIRSEGWRAILLVRRNWLRRLVSQLLARQTGLWTCTRAEFRDRVERTALRPLDPARTATQIKADMAAVQRACDLIRASGKRMKTVEFEDLFGSDVSFASKRKTIAEVADFIFAGRKPEPIRAEDLGRLLDSNRYGVSDRDAYKRIPRIDEIEAAVGSDSTGWLFR